MFSDKVSEFKHDLNFLKNFKNIVTRKISGLSDCMHFFQPRIFTPGEGIAFPIRSRFSR
jgi:hypothetical protein